MEFIKKNKSFVFIFVALLVVHFLILLTQRVYPFVDIPNHLSIATIYKYYGESTNFFSKYYEISSRLLKPNVFHSIFCGLFSNVEFGNTVFYLIYAFSMPTLVFLIIKRVGGNIWFSLLSFLLLYNFNVSYGFVGYTISIPFMLLLIYLSLICFDKDFAGKRYLFRLGFSIYFILLFYMHAQQLLIGLLLFSLFSIYSNRNNIVRLFYDSLVLLPGFALLVAWFVARQGGGGIIGHMKWYYLNEYFSLFIVRIGTLFFFDNAFLGMPFLAILFSSVIVFLFVTAFVWRNPVDLIKKFSDPQMFAFLFFVVSMGIFIFIPGSLPGQSFVYQRLGVYVLLSMLMISSFVSAKSKLVYYLLPLVIVHMFLWGNHFMTYQKEIAYLREILPAGGKDKKLAALIFDLKYKNIHVYRHVNDYYIVWKKGIVNSLILDFVFYDVVRRKVGVDILPRDKEHELVAIKRNYRGGYNNMDYILVRGKVPADTKVYLSEFNVAKQVDKWTLLEKK